MEEPKKDGFKVKIRAKDGDLRLDDYLKTLDGINELWRAVCEQVTGDPDSVGLRITELKFECDGCGVTRPADHSDWVNKGGRDYCPDCQMSVAEDEG